MLDADVEVDRREFTVRAAVRVAPGERLALFGPSGAGKTTLLETIAGLVPPRRGRVELAGRVLTSTTPPARAVPPWQRRMGLLRQDPALFPHLSVRRNLAYAPAADASAAELAALAEVLGLDRAAGRDARRAVRRPGPPGGAGPAAARALRGTAAGRALYRAGCRAAPDADGAGCPAGHRARDPGDAGRARAGRGAGLRRPAGHHRPGEAAAGGPARRGGAAAGVAAGRRTGRLPGVRAVARPEQAPGRPVPAGVPSRDASVAWPGCIRTGDPAPTRARDGADRDGHRWPARPGPAGRRTCGRSAAITWPAALPERPAAAAASWPSPPWTRRGSGRTAPRPACPAGESGRRPACTRSGPGHARSGAARAQGPRRAAGAARRGRRQPVARPPGGAGPAAARPAGPRLLPAAAGRHGGGLAAGGLGRRVRLSDPSLRVALALAHALGMTVEELFGPGSPAPRSRPARWRRWRRRAAGSSLAPVGDRLVALPLTGATADPGRVPARRRRAAPEAAGGPGRQRWSGRSARRGRRCWWPAATRRCRCWRQPLALLDPPVGLRLVAVRQQRGAPPGRGRAGARRRARTCATPR